LHRIARLRDAGHLFRRRVCRTLGRVLDLFAVRVDGLAVDRLAVGVLGVGQVINAARSL
jgi:hypothetical protein